MTLEKGRTHIYVARKIINDHSWTLGKRECVDLIFDPDTKVLRVQRLSPADARHEARRDAARTARKLARAQTSP